MSLLTWQSYYSVGVEEIDSQHKELIVLINKMYDAMRQGKGGEILASVLAELSAYAVYHFSTEERLFRDHEYPEQEAHKEIHADLSRKVQELKGDLDAGNTPAAMDVMLFMSNWLNVHILEVDKKYGPFLRGKGVR